MQLEEELQRELGIWPLFLKKTNDISSRMHLLLERFDNSKQNNNKVIDYSTGTVMDQNSLSYIHQFTIRSQAVWIPLKKQHGARPLKIPTQWQGHWGEGRKGAVFLIRNVIMNSIPKI